MVEAYLGDTEELKWTSVIFKGWVGNRENYSGLKYKDRSCQPDPRQPIDINPKGLAKLGHSIDGVPPYDQHRSGSFTLPPPKGNYVYTALRGALAQGIILYKA